MSSSSWNIYRAVLLTTTALVSYVTYTTLPDVYAADGRSGAMIILLIAASVIGLIAFLGFITLEVQSELEREEQMKARRRTAEQEKKES